MLREITIGQYYRADSIIHKLDPRTKIMGTILFIISLFIEDRWQPTSLRFFYWGW